MVLIFLRTIRATIIAGVALPLSLIATFGIMWFCGFSLDNLSLMALTIGTGFVVDDAIVMIENIVRHMEEGEDPFEAALKGAREIGFTVISLTVSLIAVFIPLLFMTGLVGRMFREFALTLTIAVVASAVVSLTLTPMMCSRLLRPHVGQAPATPSSRGFNRGVDWTVETYRRSLEWVLRHEGLTLLVTLGDPGRDRLALYRHPEGLPAAAGHRPDLRGDGRRRGRLVHRDAAAARRRSRPRSARIPTSTGVVSVVGRDAGQCHAECRRGLPSRCVRATSARTPVTPVIERLKDAVAAIPGVMSISSRCRTSRSRPASSRAQYQYTLDRHRRKEVSHWAERLAERLQAVTASCATSPPRRRTTACG